MSKCRVEARAARVVALLFAVAWGAANALHAQERPSAARLDEGEAVIHYLGHSGWAVETRDHFLVFDYRESPATPPPGVTFARPTDASLASGWIVPAEIAERNVIVFVSHAHRDHFDPVILSWADSIPNLRYVFGWNYDGPANALRVDRLRRRFDIDGVRIHTVAHDFDGIPEAAFLVESDDIVVYHSGDHGATASTSPRFEDNIDFLATIAHPVDIAFTVTWGGEDYMVDRLQPRVVFPQHEGGNEYRLRRWADKGSGATLRTTICVVANRGDTFAFQRSAAGDAVVRRLASSNAATVAPLSAGTGGCSTRRPASASSSAPSGTPG